MSTGWKCPECGAGAVRVWIDTPWLMAGPGTGAVRDEGFTPPEPDVRQEASCAACGRDGLLGDFLAAGATA